MSERLFVNTLIYFHQLMKEIIQPGDLVVDATAGNGQDTLLLAELVGPLGRVVAIDIQPMALQETGNRIKENGLADRVEIHCMDHGDMGSLNLEEVACGIFNLGYLPGLDRQVMTCGESTIQAVQALCSVLKLWGLILITIYPGSDNGYREHLLLQSYFKGLDQHRYDVISLSFPNRKNFSPYGVIIQKLQS